MSSEKSSQTKCIPFCLRAEKNRRFVLGGFNIAFAPLEKL